MVNIAYAVGCIVDCSIVLLNRSGSDLNPFDSKAPHCERQNSNGPQNISAIK